MTIPQLANCPYCNGWVAYDSTPMYGHAFDYLLWGPRKRDKELLTLMNGLRQSGGLNISPTPAGVLLQKSKQP
jgi:hypothetical protein